MVVVKLERVLNRLDAGFVDSLRRLIVWLRFASIATDPKHGQDRLGAAKWLEAGLNAEGFTAQREPTTGQPVVLATYALPLAEMQGRRHVPHVLFCRHYDVQPADPLKLWKTPPSRPRLRPGKDGRHCIYARGASGDKGQVILFVKAIGAWLAEAGRSSFRGAMPILGGDEGEALRSPDEKLNVASCHNGIYARARMSGGNAKEEARQ